jgi:hypothetical protein
MTRPMLIILMVLLLSSCLPPPQPTVSPLMPVTITPGQPPTLTPIPPTATTVPPTAAPATPIPIIQKPVSVTNPGFETFTHPITTVQEFTVATGWIPWVRNQPPCKPGFPYPCKAGSIGSPIRTCPLNCTNSQTGQCVQQYDCYWLVPEYSPMYRLDFITPPRTFEGNYSQRMFGVGRQFEAGMYQRVKVTPGATITATIMASAWMCFNAPDCKLGHMNPARQAELMQAWGVTDAYAHRLWTASDLPGYLRPDIPRYDPTDQYTPTMHLKIGIDPTGTFTGSYRGGVYVMPDLSNVVWGQERDYFDVWGKLSVTTAARAGYATVVTYARPEWPYSYWNNDVMWDLANMIESGGNILFLPVVVR